MKNHYSNIPPAMWLLALVTLISRSGNMVLVFLPLYLTQKLGFDILAAGQIVSFYGLGQILGAYVGGVATDKFGSTKVQTLGFLMVGSFYVSLAFLEVKLAIMFSMFLVGIFTASIRPATNASISKLCDQSVRTRAFALNYQAVNLGASIGPAIGGLLAGINYFLIFPLDGIANILAGISVWIFFRNEITNKPGNHVCDGIKNEGSALKDYPFLFFLLLISLVGICFFQILNIYPLYLSNDYHLSTFEIGVVMALNGILIILFQMPLTSALKKINGLRIISAGGLLICSGYFILPLYSGFYYALFSMCVITFGEMLLMPFAFEVVMKIAPSSNRGQYLGLLTCALSSIPLFITPNLMPYFYTHFGANILWFSMGIIAFIIFIGFEFLTQTNISLKLYKVEYSTIK